MIEYKKKEEINTRKIQEDPHGSPILKIKSGNVDYSKS